MNTLRLFVGSIACSFVLLHPTPVPAQEGSSEGIDFNRARVLLQRERAGDPLSFEEQAYLDRARVLRRQNAAAEGDRTDGGGDSVGTDRSARP